MNDAPVAVEELVTDSPATGRRAEDKRSRDDAFLIGSGWFATAMAHTLTEIPFNYVLKDQLHLNAEGASLFKTIAAIPIYIKPFAGILSDAVPLCGTRRRHYLLLSLVAGALCWLALGVVPRAFGAMVTTYFILNVFLTLTSTVLGGVMVEVGQRDGSTGRLSAQRLGITKFVKLVADPAGGVLAKVPFFFTTVISAVLHLALVPLIYFRLKEPPTAKTDVAALIEVKRQFRELFRSRTLWSAAGLVILVVASPGFNTPLFYYQTKTLGFSSEFIGILGMVVAIGTAVGAWIYGHFCRRLNLRVLLAVSIVVHALGTLLFLGYRTQESALIIQGVEAATHALALLPLYDLAARATPRGSEALGYCVMMSVWNFTNQMSDLTGAWMYDHLGFSFRDLIWVNIGTTLLVLVAVPFLPAVLMNRKDGDPHLT
jgi:Na+/melibiose symporter-like transporter